MKIPINIGKRIKKEMASKPELQTPFVQGDYEYITNAIYMVKAKKSEDQKEDGRNVPVMKGVEEMAMPKCDEDDAPILRLNVSYLIDILEILKKNGASFVDVRMGKRAIQMKGRSTFFDNIPNTIDISALLMCITTR